MLTFILKKDPYIFEIFLIAAQILKWFDFGSQRPKDIPSTPLSSVSRSIKCVWLVLTFLYQSRESSQMTLLLLGLPPPPALSIKASPPTPAHRCSQFPYLFSTQLPWAAEGIIEASEAQPGGYTGLNWEETEVTDGLLTLYRDKE